MKRIMGLGAARRVLVVATLSVTACGGASTPATATPASTRPAQTALTAATATLTATPSPTTPAACWPISGGTTGRARIADMRIGTSNGDDTLVIQFDNAVPHYDLSQNSTGVQFAGGGGRGGTFTLAGIHGLRLNISNLNWSTPPGDQYPHGTDLKQSAPALQEARQIGDFEGIANIAIGLSRDICPTISMLSSPPRLEIQFPTR